MQTGQAFTHYELGGKWVSKIMSSAEKLPLNVLRDNYGTWKEWKVHAAPMYWNGLRHIYLQVWEFFVAKLGDGVLFCFWLHDWSIRGIL